MQHFCDGLMYHLQQLQQCSSPFIIEFMNWYFMCFLRARVEPLHTLMLVGFFLPSILVYTVHWGSVETVRPHYLLNTPNLGIFGGLASQFSCCRLIRFHTDVQLWYSTTLTFIVNLLFITNVFFFQDFIRAQKIFHYPTRYYSTTRLLGHYPTLPYSKWKTNTRWGLLWSDIRCRLAIGGCSRQLKCYQKCNKHLISNLLMRYSVNGSVSEAV